MNTPLDIQLFTVAAFSWMAYINAYHIFILSTKKEFMDDADHLPRICTEKNKRQTEIEFWNKSFKLCVSFH